MTQARASHAAASINGRLQVMGGEGGPGCGPISSAEEHDPETGLWSTLPPMPTPRFATGAGALGAAIYVPGGAVDGGVPSAVVERLVQQ